MRDPAVRPDPFFLHGNLFQYALILHCIVTGEKLTRSDLHFQRHEETVWGKRRAPQCSRHRVYFNSPMEGFETVI